MRVFRLTFSLFVLLAPGLLKARVVLSEIMFNPQGTERYNEFVEIYNTSNSDSVDLTGWTLGDETKASELLPNDGGLKIAPHQFAIILSPNYFTNSTLYKDRIPPTALQLTIKSAQFGAYGLANDRGERVTLADSSQMVQSQWQYDVPNQDGFSEEKRVLGFGDLPENWGNSLAAGGTPGFENSLTPYSVDMALDSVNVTTIPVHPTHDDSISFQIVIKNAGTAAIDQTTLLFYEKSVAALTLLQERSFHFAPLQWLDSQSLAITLPPMSTGRHNILISHLTPGDQNSANDSIMFELEVTPARGDVQLSELFLYPAPDQWPWFELVNRSADSLDMSGWSVQAGKQNILIPTDNPLWISGGQRLLLSRSADIEKNFWQTGSKIVVLEIPDWEEGTDLIRLKSSSGVTIDSVFVGFMPASTGRSYERAELARDRWGLSPHPLGATPGEPNAFGRDYLDISFCSQFALKPKSAIYGEKIQITFCLTNWGTVTATSFSVTIFNEESDSLLLQLSPAISILPKSELRLPLEIVFPAPGVYKLRALLSATDEDYTNNNVVQFSLAVGYPPQSAVINEIMYKTDEREEEWIELYNPGPKSLNLLNWTIGDSRKAVVISEKDFLFPPKRFVLISHKTVAGAQVLVTNLPELNNSGDQIVIKDFAQNVIDSLEYLPSWGGDRFVSLERVRPEESSLDAANWASSKDSSGHSGGRKNSVSPRLYDIAVDNSSISVFPQKPVEGESVAFSLLVENRGLTPLLESVLRITLFPLADTTGVLLADSITVPRLAERESQSLKWDWQSGTGGSYIIRFTAINALDDLPENNSAEVQFSVGYPQAAVVINEIMYRPAPGRQDWIELLNPGTEKIELAGWSVSNSDTTRRIGLSGQSLVLHGQEFLVLSKDTLLLSEVPSFRIRYAGSLPNFRNEPDAVYLFDAVGHLIDVVNYQPEWGDLRGRSLERINPAGGSNDPGNWAQNVQAIGHSAGEQNSLFTRVVPGRSALEIAPDPFSPNGDGLDDVAAITVTLPSELSRINIKIFDIRGHLVRFLINDEPSGSSRTLFWDGRNDKGRLCRVGLYIVYLQAIDERNRRIIEQKKTVVLAAPL